MIQTQKIGLFLLILLFITLIQFQTGFVVGTDPYYHVQVSNLGTSLLWKAFPWTQTNLFAKHFADKEFLFHVLLMPFVYAGGLFGAKLATVLFATMAFTAFYWLGRKHDAPMPFLWVILLFAAADLFLYRISITRPHILSLFLTLLLCQALLEKRIWRIAGLCAIFVMTYTAYHLVIGFAVLYCLNHLLHQRKWDSTVLTFAVFGTCLGILIHPHFPNNLLIWKVQNVDVLKLVWSSVDLGFGSEFQPPDSRWFIVNFTVAFFCLPVALFGLAWKKSEMKEDTTFFVFLAFGFLCLTMMSKRFAEYWPVYALLATACLARDMKLPLGWHYFTTRPPKKHEERLAWRTGVRTTAIVTILSVFFCIKTVSKGMYLNSLEHEPYYKEAALWMKEHIPSKETVFHSDWDEFPQLFYYNPNNYYLVCLDPIFMYAHDPELWLKWRKIVMGESRNPQLDIKNLFNARFAFFSIEFTKAIEQLRAHTNFTVSYEDDHCVVFELHEKPDVDNNQKKTIQRTPEASGN